MYALYWLMGVPCASMGAPQTGALYLSAGLFSSLASHCGGLLRVRGPVSSSVGASGAIYGCAAATAALYPELQVRG
jgi:membrane associated rhomboid family serine protease